MNMRCILLLSQAVLLEPVHRLRLLFCPCSCAHATRLLLAPTVWMDPVLSLRDVPPVSGWRVAGQDECVPF